MTYVSADGQFFQVAIAKTKKVQKKDWTVPQWSKVLFSAWSPVLSFPSLW